VEAKRRLREEEDKGKPRGGEGQGEAKGRPRDSRGRRCRPRGGQGRVKEQVVIPFCISSKTPYTLSLTLTTTSVLSGSLD
jgi:hypothetical protein